MLELAQALVDAGGWTAFVLVVIVAAVALIRGAWVPGYIYRREVARADTATTQADRNADAIEDLTDVLANRARRRRQSRAQAG